MRLIDADALLEHQVEADKMGAMLVVGKGFIMDAPTITPQPDPDTGLVPCGCGGKPVFIEFFDGFFDFERITCSECQIEFTTTSVGCGALLWNKAMGWRGDNES